MTYDSRFTYAAPPPPAGQAAVYAPATAVEPPGRTRPHDGHIRTARIVAAIISTLAALLLAAAILVAAAIAYTTTSAPTGGATVAVAAGVAAGGAVTALLLLGFAQVIRMTALTAERTH